MLFRSVSQSRYDRCFLVVLFEVVYCVVVWIEGDDLNGARHWPAFFVSWMVFFHMVWNCLLVLWSLIYGMLKFGVMVLVFLLKKLY